MPSHTMTFHLDAPPERVFDYIADIRNEAEWSRPGQFRAALSGR